MGLEDRLMASRPADAEPAPGTEERIWAALNSPDPHGRARTAAGWRALGSRRGGRLLGVAAVLVVGGGAVAFATGVIGGHAAHRAAAEAPPATWSHPTPLTGGLRMPPVPRVVMDADGNAAVAWATAGRIEIALRPARSRWSAPRPVSPPGVPSTGAAVAVAGDGSLVVVWRERRGGVVERRELRLPDGELAGVINRRVGGTFVVVARRRDADGAWQEPQDLSAAGADRRDMVEPAAVGEGAAFLVAWSRAGHIETRALGTDGSLEEVRQVGADGGRAYRPVLAASPDEGAVMAWSIEMTGPGLGLEARTYSVGVSHRDGDEWSEPAMPARGLVDEPQPSVAAGDDGQGAVVFVSKRARRPSVIGASRLGADGRWGTTAILSSPRRSSYAPSVAIDGDANTVALWSVGAATQTAVAARGARWGRASSSGSAGLSPQYGAGAPGLATDGAGRLVGAFGENAGVLARDWPRGGPFGHPEQVIAGTGWQFGFAGLAAAPTGSAVMVVVGLGLKETYGRGWDVRAIVREPQEGSR